MNDLVVPQSCPSQMVESHHQHRLVRLVLTAIVEWKDSSPWQ